GMIRSRPSPRRSRRSQPHGAEMERFEADSDPLLASLASRVAASAGLHLAERQRWLLAARVDARRALRGETRARYVARVLDGDLEELTTLIELLRVGETRFYRHPRQLRALRRIALPELLATCEAERR